MVLGSKERRILGVIDVRTKQLTCVITIPVRTSIEN